MYNEIGNILYYSSEASFIVKFFLNDYRSWTWPREIGRKLILPNLREDENMGETCRGSATLLTEQRTDQMIVMISIGIVFALAVGGFIVAANIYGDQSHGPPDNVQHSVIDHFDPAERAQLQVLREPGFVMESECDCWTFHTERGYIDWYWNIPQVLPLCISNDTLLGWSLTVFVYGGYEPIDGDILLTQKGIDKGIIYMDWKWDAKGPCCAYDYWIATFYVKEDFCLDSDQYPDEVGSGYIPEKYVWFNWCTDWTGCPEPNQRFTIIHSHSYRALSKSFILTLQTKPLNKNPNCYHTPFHNLK